MCGLVGYIGLNTVQRDKIFREMLSLDVIRGEDSTGAAFVLANGQVDIVKDAVLPPDLMSFKKFSHMIDRKNLCLIGHNRAATKGKVDVKNAHPFHHGNIVGAHNGTLVSQNKLLDFKRFENDSDNIFYHMSKAGVDDLWNNLDGAAALTFFDTDEGTMNLIRNLERPLHFAYTKEHDGLFWSSEAGLLKYACDRNALPMDNTFGLNPNILFSFSYGKDATVTHVTRELEPFRFFSRSFRGYANWPGFRKEDNEKWNVLDLPLYGDKNKKEIVIPKAEKKLTRSEKKALRRSGKVVDLRSPKTVDPLPGTMVGFNYEILTKVAFENHYKGCAFCQSNLEFGDDGIEFIDDNLAACAECSDISQTLGIKASS